MLLTVAASAQESLCNPCVDPPTNRIRRDDFIGPDATVTVTTEDMRNLGVTTVAEMIAQLPSSVPAAVPAPVFLGDPDVYPAPYVFVFTAAAGHVRELEYDPREFNARIDSCTDSTCSVAIYPVELEGTSPSSASGCPLKYCATMTYSLEEDRVLRISDWR